MNLQSRVPEYSVEELERTPHMVNGQVCTNRNYREVTAELALLSKELKISTDILGRIQNSLHVLVQSLGEQQ